jgi:hypothetical protein
LPNKQNKLDRTDNDKHRSEEPRRIVNEPMPKHVYSKLSEQKMNVINRFSSSDIVPGDSIIIEYDWDSEGNPVFKFRHMRSTRHAYALPPML